MGFSRQEYWSGWPFPSPGDLPDPPTWRQILTTGPPGNSLGCLSAKRLFWRSLDWSWVLNIENMGKQREKEGGILGMRHSLSEQRQRLDTVLEGSGSHRCLPICVCAPPEGKTTHSSPGTPRGGLDRPSLLCPQSPAVIDSPLKLELRVMEPPRCTIKPSGTTVSVTTSVTIALVPPNQPEVQLSSMIMVRTPEQGMQRVKEGGHHPLWGSNTTLPAFPPRMPDSAPRWPSGGRRCAPSWTCAGGQVSEGLG